MTNETGKMPDVSDSDVSDSDTSRNQVETGYKRKSGNKTLNAVLAIVACLIVFGVIAYYLFPSSGGNDAEISNVKKDEALLNPVDTNNSLASQMAAIKKQQAEEERLRKEAEEAERLRKLQEEQEQAAATQQEAAISARINNEPTTQDVVVSDEQVETPAQRRLRGQALIDLSANKQSDSENANEIDSSLKGCVWTRLN